MLGGYCRLLGDACGLAASLPGGGPAGLRLPLGSPPGPQLVLLLIAAHLLAAIGIGLLCLATGRRERRGTASAAQFSPPGDPAPDGPPCAGAGLDGFTPTERQRLRFLAWRFRRGDLTEWPASPALPGGASLGDAE